MSSFMVLKRCFSGLAEFDKLEGCRSYTTDLTVLKVSLFARVIETSLQWFVVAAAKAILAAERLCLGVTGEQ